MHASRCVQASSARRAIAISGKTLKNIHRGSLAFPRGRRYTVCFKAVG
jgi:hypothetical protein